MVAGGDTSGIGGLRGSLVLGIDGSATDGDHRLRLHAEAGAASGDADLTLRVDRVPPDVTSTRPRVTLGKGRAFDGTATVRVAWTATDAVSGVARTDLERSRGGTWTRVARSTASGTANLPLRHRLQRAVPDRRPRPCRQHRHLARRVDPPPGARLIDGAVVVDRLVADPARVERLGAQRAHRPGLGARATLRFTGRAVAVVAPRGPGKGSIDVTIDGVRVATVDLAAPRSKPRRIVFASSALTPGDHVITVRTRRAGTELDAILVLE